MILLKQSVRYIKGVGPAKAAKLARLGIHTAEDILSYYPREWSDRRLCMPIGRLCAGVKTTVQGRIEYSSVKRLKQLGVFHLYVRDPSGLLDAVWIRRISYAYDVFGSLSKKFKPGEKIILYGYVDRFFSSLQMRVEDYELNCTDAGALLRILPIYPLTEGLDNRFFRCIVSSVLTDMPDDMYDVVPPDLIKRRNLLEQSQAIKQIHFPSTIEEAERARKSLAYREFLFLAISYALNRSAAQQQKKTHRYEIKRNLLAQFKNNLSFEFTAAQKRVIREVFSDMQSTSIMNRLLQGDVGSGKTVVAVSAMLLSVENGYQAAFMAPTEILAEQHFYTLQKFCRDLPLHIGLIKSGLKKKEKQTLLSRIKSGEISILVGTHAVIEADVYFKDLRLVIIDEQHRFGVMQRACLRSKGEVDTLVMTATPIPRTLALTMYGDLDISILDEMPPGRKQITTIHTADEQAYRIIKREIGKNNQAYIVYPLVKESDKSELKSVVQEWKLLKESVFKFYRVEMLHGQMPHNEKYAIMKQFAEGHIDILMATTVIEVGIDVPNATVMFIRHADRFGLATLHQLRGRIGRGSQPAFCLLGGRPTTINAKKRFTILTQTNDGFLIGEEDLKLRGPGEFMGTAQHGIPHLKAGDLTRDIALIADAHEDARGLIHNATVVHAVKTHYGDKINLVNVG